MLKDLSISKELFESSIEYHNDEEIFNILQYLTIEPDNLVEYTKEDALKIRDVYLRAENEIISDPSAKGYDSFVISAIIEDKIWIEFGIELADFIRYCETQVQDREFEELRNSMVSFQMLDSNLFV